MTMLPMKQKCEVCGKIFTFNPSVGKINCPRCGALLGTKSDDISMPQKEYSELNKDTHR